ncbi:hypothetical protein [Lederbergia citrea]|uniref:Uncharacterized protein n=1 Tax=Lederbergia citrea TaxID=2833581 RepID=A0A942USJ9_9BACI|nr:hypothetical protein [Lederbergia citrea]MBS4176608.1 hypothetical protein [Lederbergia citrea]MBS4203169.1 hypothetical protein [Lederbergia citrea]MBS4222159.1 hypothetical protein [Lederbergia citrea]
MPRNLADFERITKAIYSSYELLREKEQPPQMALDSLREAEHSLNKAIDFLLSQDRSYGPS